MARVYSIAALYSDLRQPFHFPKSYKRFCLYTFVQCLDAVQVKDAAETSRWFCGCWNAKARAMASALAFLSGCG